MVGKLEHLSRASSNNHSIMPIIGLFFNIFAKENDIVAHQLSDLYAVGIFQTHPLLWFDPSASKAKTTFHPFTL